VHHLGGAQVKVVEQRLAVRWTVVVVAVVGALALLGLIGL